MRTFYSTLFVLLLTACNAVNDNRSKNNSAEKIAGNSGSDSVVFTADNISMERKNVNTRPVKTYTETIQSFETTDEFKVSLYETKLTFKYLMKISYKNIDVQDTLKVPNFGIEPSVEIVKGESTRPSCIVGFFDKENKFRESKLVLFDKNKLKVRVLKHYAVATYQHIQ